MNQELESLLKDEYFHLQAVVEASDSKALTIKAWSVTASLGGAAAAFFGGNAKPELLLLAAGGSALFWLIEGRWKVFQRAYYGRIAELEEHFAGSGVPIVPLQIYSSWWKEFRESKLAWRALLWPHVWLPHGVICGGGIVTYGALKILERLAS